MTYLIDLFRSPRPVWYRPSAIAVGFIAAQYLDQWLRTGGIRSISGY